MDFSAIPGVIGISRKLYYINIHIKRHIKFKFQNTVQAMTNTLTAYEDAVATWNSLTEHITRMHSNEETGAFTIISGRVLMHEGELIGICAHHFRPV